MMLGFACPPREGNPMRAFGRKIPARFPTAMLETLEARSLLSAQILDLPQFIDSPAALELPLISESSSTQTVTTLSVSGDFVERSTLTLTATVTNADPAGPVPTGSVAFVSIRYPR